MIRARNILTSIALMLMAFSVITPVASSSASLIVKTTIALDSGGSTTCALRAGNNVFCVGDNSFGQLGDNSTISKSEPVFAGVSQAKMVSVGSSSACAINSEGFGVCWGDNAKGQLGNAASGSVARSITLSQKLIDISVGDTFACAVTESFLLYCWGEFPNNAVAKVSSTPVLVQGLSGVTSVSVGKTAVCAVATDVYCFGSLVKSDIPIAISQTAGARQVSVGDNFACALVSAQVRCWGDNSQGQLGQGNTSALTSTVTVTGINDAWFISAGAQFACALSETNSTYCWGDNSSSQIGTGTVDQTTRVPVSLGSAVLITTGAAFTCALLADASIKCRGDNSKGQSGVLTSSTVPLTVPNRISVVEVSSGANTTCVIDMVSNLTCWGDLIPTLQPGAKFKSVAVGNISACAISDESKVYCWGSNSAGQLGDGSNKSSDVPVAVVGIGNLSVTHLAAGYRHFCASTDGGFIFCWGDNSKDQLGFEGDDSKTAVAVDGIGTGVDISVGDYHSCALLSTKDVKCWGDNSKRQITAAAVAKVPPTFLPDATNVKKVVASVGNTCWLLLDSSAKCIGDNAESQAPATIVGAFTDLAMGNKTVCFIKSVSATVSCLGSNNANKLGRVGLKSATLVDIPNLTARAISVGADHVCVITTDSQLSCWGSNSSGQLASSFGFPSAYSAAQLSVSGKRNVGEFLELVDFPTDSGTSIDVSWYRSTEKDGTYSKISNQSEKSLYLSPSDINRFFKVQVVLHKWDSSSIAYRSEPVGPISSQLRILISSTPTISGKSKVGSFLRVSTGRWESGAKLTLQWYRGSAKIKGATSNSYKLTTLDVGKQISVWVTGTKGMLPKLVLKSVKTSKITQ